MSFTRTRSNRARRSGSPWVSHSPVSALYSFQTPVITPPGASQANSPATQRWTASSTSWGTKKLDQGSARVWEKASSTSGVSSVSAGALWSL